MYKINCTDEIKAKLVELNRANTSISEDFKALAQNPFASAIKMQIPRVSEYYFISGVNAILIDIDSDKRIVDIRSIVAQETLDKAKGILNK